ncbi:MAG TPA: NUDIX hydrolase [Pseudolabrys sp.]
MLSSACQQWQHDQAANAAQDTRSYTTHGGTIEPIRSAQRELAEETGLRARRWREILQLDLSNSATDEHAHLFLAWDLRQGKARPEECEDLAVRREPLPRVVRMIERGLITDVMTVAAIQKVQLLALAGKLPSSLRDALLA